MFLAVILICAGAANSSDCMPLAAPILLPNFDICNKVVVTQAEKIKQSGVEGTVISYCVDLRQGLQASYTF